jgi:hypothetical protein
MHPRQQKCAANETPRHFPVVRTPGIEHEVTGLNSFAVNPELTPENT